MKQQRKQPVDEPAPAIRSPLPSVKARPPDSGVLHSKYWSWFLGLLLIAALFLAYLPALRGGFIWDDDAHLTANPCIIGPVGFKGIWTSSAATYYPLVLTSFWVQHAIWGLNPLPYHLVNVAMHAACAVLLWRVLRCLKMGGAWLGAALWGLHPVQTESVAWITELKNTQSCLFYLLAVWFFLKWRAAGTFAGRKGTEWDYALALLCAALAILSKASTVVLPVVLGLVWWWSDGRWRWRNVFRLALFFIISAAASGWTIWEQQFHSGAVGPEWSQSRPERLVIAGKAVWFYLGKLLWPHPLIFIYPRWEIDASRPLAYWPILALGATLLLLWLNRRGRTGPVFFAFGYFVALLFPVLGFFNVYFFRYSFVGDHFQYLAGIGPLVLAAAGITIAFKNKPWLQWTVGGVLLLTLGLLTWRQAEIYRNPETLWRDTLAKNPACWMAHNNLGSVLLQKGEVDEAISQLQEAIRLKPANAKAHYNLGIALEKKGQTDAAVSQYREAIRLKPDYAEVYNNLGAALGQEGQVAEAISLFREAIHLQPDYEEAYNNLGNAFLQKGEVDEAISQFQEAIRLKPAYTKAHYNLGVALEKEGQTDAAVRQYREAIRLKPDYAEAYNNLGAALSHKGQIAEAISQFREAIRLKPDYAEARDNLERALEMKNATGER